MIDLLNQGMVITIAIGWAYLGLLILNPIPPDGTPHLYQKVVGAGLFLESFFVLWVGLTRPPYGKSLGFLGLGLAVWAVNYGMYRTQQKRSHAHR